MPENESKKKKSILSRLHHKNQQIKKLRNKPNQGSERHTLKTIKNIQERKLKVIHKIE